MKALVIGASGMLGTDLVMELEKRGHEVVAPSINEVDLRSPSMVANIAGTKMCTCDWCFNCAAYTAVDKAEVDVEAATLVNTLGPGYLARMCALTGMKLLHVSTDFVFDGTATEPYTEDVPTNPIGVYGKTKRDGEENVRAAHGSALIVRTAWLYGPHGPSFPKTMIRAWLASKPLKVVSDQTGSPTYTAHLARVLVDLAELNPPAGTFHAAGPSAMTWYDFAQLAIRTYRDELLREETPFSVEPIKSEDWPTAAKRPTYSVLSFEKLAELGIEPMPPVREALQEFVRRLPQSDV